MSVEVSCLFCAYCCICTCFHNCYGWQSCFHWQNLQFDPHHCWHLWGWRFTLSTVIFLLPSHSYTDIPRCKLFILYMFKDLLPHITLSLSQGTYYWSDTPAFSSHRWHKSFPLQQAPPPSVPHIKNLVVLTFLRMGHWSISSSLFSMKSTIQGILYVQNEMGGVLSCWHMDSVSFLHSVFSVFGKQRVLACQVASLHGVSYKREWSYHTVIQNCTHIIHSVLECHAHTQKLKWLFISQNFTSCNV